MGCPEIHPSPTEKTLFHALNAFDIIQVQSELIELTAGFQAALD